MLSCRKKKRIFLTMFPTRFQDQEGTLRLLLLSRFSRVRLRRCQPTRLRRPWDSLGKNTGVGCHFLLQERTLDAAK